MRRATVLILLFANNNYGNITWGRALVQAVLNNGGLQLFLPTKNYRLYRVKQSKYDYVYVILSVYVSC